MKATMLTFAEIVLTSTLLVSLPCGSQEQQNPRENTIQSSDKGLKTMESKSVSLEGKANVNKEDENRNASNPKASDSPLVYLPTINETINATSDLSIDDFSGVPRPTPTFSTSPPLIHGFVSKLPLNSSLTNESLLQVSPHQNSTFAVPSENFNWSLDNDTMKTSGNSSTAVSILPAAPTTKSLTHLTAEPTGWLITNSNNFAGFTPYQENATLQPTLKFTNNSKLFPNTSDPQKENRNAGIVFGAILGAILGVSLLSLVGYLLCGKRKTDSFSHQRLYEDRNEPVLRLDNTPEPYDGSFGNSSYYNPPVNDSSMPESRENALDGIPMDDIPPLPTTV
ncbi:mucin-15 [Castor canadensis]|uniref:Mucin-15 n=6 Tax=Castor canadensis TaxID=51338 RepID=A0AC58K2Y7_CASCN